MSVMTRGEANMPILQLPAAMKIGLGDGIPHLVACGIDHETSHLSPLTRDVDTSDISGARVQVGPP